MKGEAAVSPLGFSERIGITLPSILNAPSASLQPEIVGVHMTLSEQPSIKPG